MAPSIDDKQAWIGLLISDVNGFNNAKRSLAKGVRLDLSGADLSGRALGDANLAALDLSRANLAGATVAATDLVMSRLEGARLDGLKDIDNDAQTMQTL